MRLGLRILFVLLFLRLMAPPGICLCKLNASAILFPQGTVPSESDEPDDDHAPGCPCSPLAAGMGLRVPVESAPVPVLSFEVPPFPSVVVGVQPLFTIAPPHHPPHPTLFDNSRLLLL